MSEITMRDIIEAVSDFWKLTTIVFALAFLLLTSPLWVLPYAIFKRLKYGRWF